jgi:hypothetical protein
MIIDIPPDIVWSEVQTAPPARAYRGPLVRFIQVGSEPFEHFKPGGEYQVN